MRKEKLLHNNRYNAKDEQAKRNQVLGLHEQLAMTQQQADGKEHVKISAEIEQIDHKSMTIDPGRIIVKDPAEQRVKREREKDAKNLR